MTGIQKRTATQRKNQDERQQQETSRHSHHRRRQQKTQSPWGAGSIIPNEYLVDDRI